MNMQDSSSTSGRTAGQSLHRQLTWRLFAVFLVVSVLGNLLALASYRGIAQRAQHDAADSAEIYIRNSFRQMNAGWELDAQAVKAQIDFMRIFADDPANSWLRLRAYFATLEGRVGQFSSGVVLHDDRSPTFSFGRDGAALSRHLDGERAPPVWFYGKEHRTVYALVSTPLWLGSEGTGRMTLMRPVDAGVLRALAPPDIHLCLVLDGRVVASSDGSEDIGKTVDASYRGELVFDDHVMEQRVFPVFDDDAGAPRLVIRQIVREPLSTLFVLSASTALLTFFAAVLWLVIGRWASRVTERVTRLSQASGLFAREHAMGDALLQALDSAESRPDEIGEVARASRTLMQNVLLHDQEHFAYLQTLDILDEGVVEIAADGRYLRASPGWTRLIGRSRQAVDDRIYDSIHPEDESHLRQQLSQLLAGEKTSLTGRIRLRRDDSKDLWIEYRFVPGIAGTPGGASLRGVLRDITQSYLLEKHITHMALHDALTELPNRVLLEDRANIALRMAQRNGHKVALGFMDLDHFKHVNDQHGHKAGDDMLVTLSQNLRQHLRSGDTLARWGGDEFVVLLTDLTSIDDAREVMTKLSAACEAPIVIDGNEFNATFSMGVALYPDDAETTETLLAQADRAMFHAKEQGRNTVRFFADMTNREQNIKALYIQNRLATAIREHRIQTWFQPIVDAKTRRIVGCEALARWHDETCGQVSPATFIPMAENLGLIREIGHQVWLQAVENLHRWREAGIDIKVSVNVSRRQLFTPSFTADLLDDLHRLNVPVSSIDLEITESVAMEDAEHTTKRLQELTEAGFSIAIDDFGTGYSSLSQLHDMPATRAKIDISFVRRVHTEQGMQLIQAIIKIATAFGLKTVAEGVEDAETAATLERLGVDMLQGYHFGKPASADLFQRTLQDSFGQPPP